MVVWARLAMAPIQDCGVDKQYKLKIESVRQAASNIALEKAGFPHQLPSSDSSDPISNRVFAAQLFENGRPELGKHRLEGDGQVHRT
jgi:hypothetical protein